MRKSLGVGSYICVLLQTRNARRDTIIGDNTIRDFVHKSHCKNLFNL